MKPGRKLNLHKRRYDEQEKLSDRLKSLRQGKLQSLLLFKICREVAGRTIQGKQYNRNAHVLHYYTERSEQMKRSQGLLKN